MPSENSRRQFTNWFKKTYPLEYYYFHKIESNVDQLYAHDDLALHEGEFAEISLNIRKSEDDKYQLAANPYTAIFLGSTFKTMMDEITNNIKSIVSKKIQEEFENNFSIKCSKCEKMNVSGSMFCNSCGSEVRPP